MVADALVSGQHSTVHHRRPEGAVAGVARKEERSRDGRCVGLVRSDLTRPARIAQRLQLMRAGELPEPQLNVVVTDDAGFSDCDASCGVGRVRTLVVSTTGDDHRTSRAQFQRDITRIERYADGDGSPSGRTRAHVFGDPNPFIGRLTTARDRAVALHASGWTAAYCAREAVERTSAAVRRRFAAGPAERAAAAREQPRGSPR